MHSCPLAVAVVAVVAVVSAAAAVLAVVLAAGVTATVAAIHRTFAWASPRRSAWWMARPFALHTRRSRRSRRVFGRNLHSIRNVRRGQLVVAPWPAHGFSAFSRFSTVPPKELGAGEGLPM